MIPWLPAKPVNTNKIDWVLVEQMKRDEPAFVKQARVDYLKQEIKRLDAELDDDVLFHISINARMPATDDAPTTQLLLMSMRDEKKTRMNKMKLELKSLRRADTEGWLTTEQIDRARAVPLTSLIEQVAGKNVLCPSHNDTTPSLTVYEDHAFCFVCRAHFDSIAWTMKVRGLSFVDAVKVLT